MGLTTQFLCDPKIMKLFCAILVAASAVITSDDGYNNILLVLLQ